MTVTELDELTDVDVHRRLVEHGVHRDHADQVVAARDQPDVAARIAAILTQPTSA